MKTKFSNSELCHVWASQSQEYGNGSNLNFIGKKLLSYNWYTIGMFINSDTVLIRKSTYSNSTAKHFNHMNSAIGSHIKQITVNSLPDNRYSCSDTIDHSLNINSFVKDINSFLPTFNKARTNKQYLYNDYLRNIESLQSYCTLFNLDTPTLPEINLYFIQSEIEKIEQKRKEKEEKEQIYFDYIKQNSKQSLLNVTEKWLKGETNDTSIYYEKRKGQRYYFSIEETLLRLKDNNVQTSKGANVPVKDAEILYHMIKAGKDIKGFRIGNYTVIGINGVLKIGCHEISKEEINRFAALMNW